MDNLPPETRDEFYADFIAIQKEMRSCVVDKRSRAADRDWRLWVEFCATHNLDPDDTTTDRIPYLQVFARRIRDGRLAPGGNPV